MALDQFIKTGSREMFPTRKIEEMKFFPAEWCEALSHVSTRRVRTYRYQVHFEETEQF